MLKLMDDIQDLEEFQEFQRDFGWRIRRIVEVYVWTTVWDRMFRLAEGPGKNLLLSEMHNLGFSS